MDLKSMFPSNISGWVRYTQYEIINDHESMACVKPTEGSQPIIYNPLDVATEMLVDALNLGRDHIRGETGEHGEAYLQFFRKYGSLGMCVDLAGGEKYMASGNDISLHTEEFEFLTKTMTVGDYHRLFFGEYEAPSNEQPKLGDVTRRSDVFNEIFSTTYRERTRNVQAYFVRLYKRFNDCYDYSIAKPQSDVKHINFTKDLQYKIVDEGKATMQWYFPTLKTVIDLVFALSVTADDMPIKFCKKCGRVYFNDNSRSEFCSPRCRNQWNVYKSRGNLGALIAEEDKDEMYIDMIARKRRNIERE